jgi:hypothetical protein
MAIHAHGPSFPTHLPPSFPLQAASSEAAIPEFPNGWINLVSQSD